MELRSETLNTHKSPLVDVQQNPKFERVQMLNDYVDSVYVHFILRGKSESKTRKRTTHRTAANKTVSNILIGRDIARAVSRRLPTAAARVQTRV
jgi:hypothetical protein